MTTGPTVSALPASTTTYTVTATSGAGCTSTATASVNVTAGPNVTVSATPGTICPGGDVQLNTTAVPGNASNYTFVLQFKLHSFGWRYTGFCNSCR